VNFTGMTPDIISKNRVTFDNVRVWDWRVLQAITVSIRASGFITHFPTVNVVRYTINGRLQQLMYSARELDIEKLAGTIQDLAEPHLCYTQWYGAVANPVNKVTSERGLRIIGLRISLLSQIF